MSRIAIITGGAQGIGAAAARRFKAEGFRGVVLVDRNAEGLEKTSKTLGGPGWAQTLTADLRDDATAQKAVDLAVSAFGTLDVVVNAAGNTERCGVDDTTPEAFHRVFDVNVKAPLQMMQAAGRVLKAKRSGTVVNITSMLAYGGPPSIGTYSASKAALVALTRNAANAWKREGVRVFAINLGWVNSEGEHRLQTEFHKMPQNWADEIGRRMPSGRLQVPDDAAGVISFLCSPPAQMMTGAIIDYEQMPVGVYDDHPALAPL